MLTVTWTTIRRPATRRPSNPISSLKPIIASRAVGLFSEKKFVSVSKLRLHGAVDQRLNTLSQDRVRVSNGDIYATSRSTLSCQAVFESVSRSCCTTRRSGSVPHASRWSRPAAPVPVKRNETHVINNLLQFASLLPKRQHQHPKSICCYRLPAHHMEATSGLNWLKINLLVKCYTHTWRAATRPQVYLLDPHGRLPGKSKIFGLVHTQDNT
jgi:hypothetical protein